MNYRNRKTTVKNKKKPLLIGALVLVLVLATAGMLEKLNVIDLYTKNTPASVSQKGDSEAKTTSTAASAQDNFTGGTDRQPNTSVPTEGTVKDNNGAIGTVPSASEWTVSSDKAITVYSPTKSSVVNNGFVFSGVSSHSNVQFRLIDDVSGVIAQGSVNVSGGKFSGTFSFSSKGTAGRLDLFYANQDGVESSSVSIPVRYK